MVPPNGDASGRDQKTYGGNLVSNPEHGWDQRFLDGPLDLGFDPSVISREHETYLENVVSNPEHDWDQRFRDGPLDLGFDSSFITMLGVQDPPYAFFEDDVLRTKTGSRDAHSTLIRHVRTQHILKCRRLPQRNESLGGGNVLLRDRAVQNPRETCRGRYVTFLPNL